MRASLAFLLLTIFLSHSSWAQRPRFAPQVHELGLQLVQVHHLPEVAEYYAQDASFSTQFANGILYAYHLTATDALRAQVSWREADFVASDGIDRFVTYRATRSDLDINLGYQRKLNLRALQLYAGAQAMLTRGNVEDVGEGEPFSSEIYTNKYYYTNYGLGVMTGAKVFLSKHLSFGVEAQANYLRSRRQAAPDNTFYLFPEEELAIQGLAFVSLHFGKMPKRCTCPVHRR